MSHSIPLIDIGPLFGAASLDRDLTDQAIMAAAATSGFMVVRGLPSDLPAGRAARADLLRLFQLTEHETRNLWRQKFAPAHPNVYRGWFPLQTGFLTAKEGIDMGPDVVHGAARADAEIRPLPVDGASFEPFLYGDYLWATTTQFVEFRGMESLRKPVRRP